MALLFFHRYRHIFTVCSQFSLAIHSQIMTIDDVISFQCNVTFRHNKRISFDFLTIQRPIRERISLRHAASCQHDFISRNSSASVCHTAAHADCINAEDPPCILRAVKRDIVLAFRHLILDFIVSRLRGNDKRILIIGRDDAHARHIRNDLSLRLIPVEVLVLRDFFSNRVQHKVATLSAHFHAQLHRPAGLSVVFNIAADIDHISGGHNGDLFCQRVGSHIQHRDIFQHTAHIGIAIFKQGEGCGAIRIPHRSGQIISIRLVFENAAVDSRAGHIAGKHAVLDLARIITCDCTAKNAASDNADFCARARVVDRALPECAARNNTAAVADCITIIKHTA